ncbi:MAG: 1-acyl-sn-glycerol-3-phosphate acyltransferase, partial [Micromonosporaceae bacterium]|nr:1-acyl-sn-glycerol-3-phosphate acyltransferase [Micromonosporaceae bacterium]
MTSLWLPRSGCGPACLPPEGDNGRVPGWLPAVRLLRLVAALLVAAALMPLLPGWQPGRRRLAVADRCAATLRALGITVDVQGTLPRRGALLVVNHISWLDIPVLLALGGIGRAAARRDDSSAPVGVRLVAKVEVGGWPVVGPLARHAGAIFIDRCRPRRLPETVRTVATALAAGEVVAAFPEGTTTCGRATGPFRPAMFQAALDARATPLTDSVVVVPVRLRYRLADGTPTAHPAFIGDETLLQSLGRVLRIRRLRVEVRVGAAIHPDAGASRRALARLAGKAVAGEWPEWPVSPASPPA